MWKLGSSRGLPDLWNLKITFISCEVGSCFWQSLVAGARLTPLLCVEHEGVCSGVRREVPPFPRVTRCGFPHLEIKLSDLTPDSSIIPAQGMLHIPLTWGAVPGQGHLTAICSYTATWLFPHSWCQRWMWRDQWKLHRKINLAFPQLQVAFSVLRSASLGRLECICRHSQRGWIYLEKIVCSNSGFTIRC